MADLLVGIDVSRDTHHVAFTDATATEHWGRLTVPNDAGGALQLAHAIQEQATRPRAARGTSKQSHRPREAHG
jgi:hypothetical protein